MAAISDGSADGELAGPEQAHRDPQHDVVQRRVHVDRAQFVEHVAERHLGLLDRGRLVEPDAARGDQPEDEPAGRERGDQHARRGGRANAVSRRAEQPRRRSSVAVAISVAVAMPGGVVAEHDHEHDVQQRDGREQRDRAARPPTRARVRDQDAGDAEQRHRQHVRHGHRAGARVAVAEHEADEPLGRERDDGDGAEAEQAGDGERGAQRVAALAARQQHQRHGGGRERGDPAERREHGEAARLAAVEQRVGEQHVLVLDDGEQQERGDRARGLD